MSKGNAIQLPDFEQTCARAHEAWIKERKSAGANSEKLDTTGEELMVPYARLTDDGKKTVRAIVRATYDAVTEFQEQGASGAAAPRAAG